MNVKRAVIGAAATVFFLVFSTLGIATYLGWIELPAFLDNPLFWAFLTSVVGVSAIIYAVLWARNQQPTFDLDQFAGTDNELSKTELEDRVVTYLRRRECVHLEKDRSRIVLEEPTDSDDAVRLFEIRGRRINQPEEIGYVVSTEKQVSGTRMGDDDLIRGTNVDDLDAALEEARKKLANSQLPTRTIRREKPDGTVEEYNGPVIPGGQSRKQTQDIADLKQDIQNGGGGSE